jgi:copper chaperone
MASVTIAINGMSCGHCVAAVSKALAAVPGVTVEAVQIGSATVAIDPALGSLAAAEAAIDAAGYDVVKGRVLNIAMADTRDGPSVA